MRRTYSLQDLVHTLARRRWVILVPFAIGLAAAGPLGSLFPLRYRSDVELTASAGDVAGRLGSLESRLGAASLDAIAAELGSYEDARAEGGSDDVVAKMRRNIELSEGRRDGSFRLSYFDSSADAARLGAERLASLYVGGAASGDGDASATSSLDAQIAEAGRRVTAHEQKLADFRRRQAGEIRSQLQGSLQAIQRTQIQLQSVTGSIEELRDQRVQLEQQLAEAQARASAPAPDAPVSTVQQLGMARAQLQLLRLRLPPDHPDVVALERTILEIEARAAQDAARGGGAPAGAPQDAAAQRRVRALEEEIRSVDRQLSAATAEQSRLRRALDQQTRAEVTPGADAELTELTRQYDALQAAHSALLARRAAPAAAAGTAPSEGDETFSVLDPPSAPAATGAGRWRMAMTVGAPVAGLLLGLALALMVERRDSTFRREDEVRHALGLPVLALVPDMLSDTERQHLRRRTLMTDLAGAGALLASVLMLVLWR
jgi:uncharacterized protein involved in exopolysaccharide biosynthesis